MTERIDEEKSGITSDYYTPVQLAAKLNVSMKFIRKHTATKRLPGILKVGSLVRYRKTDVNRALLNGKILLD